MFFLAGFLMLLAFAYEPYFCLKINMAISPTICLLTSRMVLTSDKIAIALLR